MSGAKAVAESIAIWRDLGSAPIPGDDPAGASARSENVFELLSEEVAKHESVTAGDVDWQAVVELSAVILSTRSKDLLVAVYFCRGVFSSHGYVGLSLGLQVLDDMVEHYWEVMEPPLKRMRGRSAAVTWLVEKLAEAVRNSPAGPEQRPDADRCMALLDQLVQRINDLGMEMDAGPLRGALRHVAVMRADDVEPSTPDALTTQPSGPPSNQDDEESWQSASTVDANPNGVQAEIGSGPTKPAKTPSPAAQSTAAQTAPKPSSLQADPELRRMVKRCTDEMRKIAGAWLERDLRDSRAYRFARMSAWAGVEKAPRNDEGTVDLPPPLPNRLNTVLGLYQQKRYPEFIVEAEQINARHIFWLDGHRLVALALNGMGEQFEPAAQAVVDEVSSFLERVPEVLELRFSDGTPFAGASTRAWLEQEEAVETVGKEEGTALTQTGVSEQWGAVATKAAELADNGDFAAVARLFSEHRALASGRRSRFHWRLTEAGFYYRYGHDDVVIGMVDGMLDEVARYAIDEWEPELALSLAELGVRSAERLGKSSPGDYIDSIRQRAFELLCRLDPGSAMKVRS